MALIYVAVLDDGTSSLALRHPSRAVSQFLSSGGGESCAAVHCFLVAHLIDGTDCCGLAANQVRSSARLGFDTRVSGNYLHRFFGGTFSSQIMAAMSGMLNSPERALLLSAMGNVFIASLILLPIVLVMLLVSRFPGTVRPFPVASNDSLPVWQLALLVLIWTAIAVPAQLEQHRFVTHARFVERGGYRESLDYLGRYARKDFPASRRIEPNPYHYEAWERLPNLMAVLRPNDPEWVRRVYLDHMEALFSHHWLGCHPSRCCRCSVLWNGFLKGRSG